MLIAILRYAFYAPWQARRAINGIDKYTITNNKDYPYISIVVLDKRAFPQLRTRSNPYCCRHQVASDLKATTFDREITLERAGKDVGHLSDYSIGADERAAHERRGRGGRGKELCKRVGQLRIRQKLIVSFDSKWRARIDAA
ncbi:hypothetical protein [Trinickia sp.]|uniref:hypothetical protein n=1 Tax=Trinickia sp. TaxID=2571163 RepID=UPI003F7F34FB